MNSLMEAEAREVPYRVKEQFLANSELVNKLARVLRDFDPSLVFTVGRGSSDHVGVYAKYLIEVEMGIPTMSAAPSIVSVYNRKLNLKSALALIISQSGKSPDLLAQAKMAKESGAFTVAVVNDSESPLAELVDMVFPIHAGREQAVAATKSYLCSLSALLQLVAAWKQDQQMIDAMQSLPECLAKSIEQDAQLDFVKLTKGRRCIVLGRGFAYAISREIALKLKEIFSFQAEAFSSAEFLHGPVALADELLPIISVSIDDESLLNHMHQMTDIRNRGPEIFSLKQPIKVLHPRLAPLTLMQQFYVEAAQAAVQLGFNPDAPSGLKKVTRTL